MVQAGGAGSGGGVRVEAVAWDDPRASALREELGAELDRRYRDLVEGPLPPTMTVHAESVVWTGLARDGAGIPVGCATLRRLPPLEDVPVDPAVLELKRMFVAPGHRGTGVAATLLAAAEAAARRVGARRLVLHTGERQPEALRFYERQGYGRIPVLAHYAGAPAAVCMAKDLVPRPA